APLKSCLFPYTTLFRSVSILRGGDFDIAAMEDDDLPGSEVTHGAETGTFRSIRTGPEVTFLPATDLQDEIAQVTNLLRDWIEERSEEHTSELQSRFDLV